MSEKLPKIEDKFNTATASDDDSDDEDVQKKKIDKRPISVRAKLLAKSLALSLAQSAINLFKKNPTKILLERFADHEGLMEFALKKLQSTSSERTYWVNMWLQIDADMNNKMSYGEFCDFFSIDPDEYCSRLFLIMNPSLTGVVNFAEFLMFCFTYLTIDKNMTVEFAFRMISRRTAMEMTPYSNVGLDDVKWFVNLKYKSMGTASKRNKFANEIFFCMDGDGDGGLSIDEWEDFCETNRTFVSVFHKYLMHLRHCIMGMNFWVKRSRLIKKKVATGVNRLTRTSRINLKSEEYYALLGDQVVDSWGRPIVAKPLTTPEPVTPPTVVPPVPALALVSTKLTRSTSSSSSKDIAKQEADKELEIKKTQSLLDDEEPVVKIDPKSTLCWKGPFAFKNLPRTRKEVDFPEVEAERIRKKLLKKKEDAKLNSAADKFAGRTYDLIYNVCADLIYGRKHTRNAFIKWLEVVGMESTVQTQKKSETNKKVGKLSITLHKGSDIVAAAGLFGKADPYVWLRIKKQEFRSEACEGGGKFPVWEQNFEFQNVPVDKFVELSVTVRDDITKMGQNKVQIYDWLGPKGFSGDVNLFSHKEEKQDKVVGRINLTASFKEADKSELLSRLGEATGINAVVEKMMLEDDEKEAEQEEELEDLHSPKQNIQSSKEDEEIYRKIMENTAKMQMDESSSAFDDYTRNCVFEVSRTAGPSYDRSALLRKYKQCNSQNGDDSRQSVRADSRGEKR